jgi:hypothetical protein
MWIVHLFVFFRSNTLLMHLWMYSIVSKEAKWTSKNLMGYVSLSPSNMGLGIECFPGSIFYLNWCCNLCLSEDRKMLPPCSLGHWFVGAMELIFKAPFVSVNNYQICRQFEFIDLITWSNFLLEQLVNYAFYTMILLLYKCMDSLKVKGFFLCLHNYMSGFLWVKFCN